MRSAKSVSPKPFPEALQSEAPQSGEVWRTVPSNSRYAVSDRGQVKRIAPGCGAVVGRILKPRRERAGHLAVVLGEGSHDRRSARKVHALVLEAFDRPRLPGEESRHLDGNPENNSISNLRRGTHRENMADRDMHGRTHRPIGEKEWPGQIDCARSALDP